MLAGRPRRSDVGDCASRAQSRGLWPGSRLTCRDGFFGMLVAVGGGASPPPPPPPPPAEEEEEEEAADGGRAPRRGMGRERFGAGLAVPFKVGMRRGEEEDDGWGMPVGLDLVFGLGTGGGGMRSDAPVVTLEAAAAGGGGGGGGGGMRSDAVLGASGRTLICGGRTAGGAC